MAESTYSSTRQGLIEDELTYKEEKELLIEILDEIYEAVTVETSGSSLLAIQAAVKLLDWGTNTGLGTEEIEDAASA